MTTLQPHTTLCSCTCSSIVTVPVIVHGIQIYKIRILQEGHCKLILGTRQLAQFLKYIRKTVGKLTNNKANGHYREMAWLPFQKPIFCSIANCQNQIYKGLLIFFSFSIMFQVHQSFNYKIGKHLPVNRLKMLNNKIVLKWLNQSRDSYKVKCKEPFLKICA